MKKVIAAAAGLLALAGCTSHTTGSGSTSSTSTSKGTTSAEAQPADRLVIAVRWAPAMVTYDERVGTATDLGIYGDGRVYRLTGQPGPGRVQGYEVGEVDPADVASLAAQADSSGLIDSDTPYGYPNVADGASVVVTVNATGSPSTVSVDNPSVDSGVYGTEAKNREKLVELLDQFDELAESATYAPANVDRVQVVETASYDAAATAAWPGPDPSSVLQPLSGNKWGKACGAIAGGDAQVVLDAAVQNQHDYNWVVDGVITTLVVRPLLPGEEPCVDVK